MKKIKSQVLRQLYMETRFAPAPKQLAQARAAGELYKIIDPEKSYPFEFVCSKITGYRPRFGAASTNIPGQELKESLPIYILKITARLKLKADEQEQKIYSIDELAEKLNVSTRTIDRWRRKGLIAEKYIFSDGSLRTGFRREDVDDFSNAHPELVKNASRFSNLTIKEKTRIIDEIESLADSEQLSRQAIINRVAENTGRARETVRCVLLDYEKQNPRKDIFKKAHITIGPKARAIIYNMYQSGTSVAELCEKFQRSNSAIYRIISKRKIRRLLAHKPEYIESDEFFAEDAEQKFLGKSLSLPGILKSKRLNLSGQKGRVEQKYFDLIKKTPILNRQQEMELFRRYNFLKFLAKQIIDSLNMAKPCGKMVRKAEKLLAEAEEVKAAIIETNLRLVIRIAARHSSEENLGDLVSEGNMALMRAVEKFDYRRGFRFSTYASWVISKEFARGLPGQAERLERTAVSGMDEFQKNENRFGQTSIEAVESAHQSLEEVIAGNLTEREQHIIRYHFGLTGTLVKKKTKTLKQLGDELGLSKERVRQIELLAIQKLRQSLSAEEFRKIIG